MAATARAKSQVTPITLTDEKKGIIFRALGKMPIYSVGVEFDFDKHYANSLGVKNAVYRIYQQVRKDPNKYGVSPEVCDSVVSSVSKRSASAPAEDIVTTGTSGVLPHISETPTLREKTDVQKVDENDYTTLVLSNRTKAMSLVSKKLNTYKTKKQIDSLKLSEIVTAAAILFDKGQIIQGQATENIAIMAKIDDNITPEDALNAILRMREGNMADKDKTK